jgi:general secretion pathway protein G
VNQKRLAGSELQTSDFGPVDAVWSPKTGARSLTRSQAGYTFIEIAIVTAIIAILASAVLPLAKVTIQRNRELELRRNLREMRTAIDKFKDALEAKTISAEGLPGNNDGYPPTLQILVEGVEAANVKEEGKRLKFLRRIPVDPMTRTTEWGMRSTRDQPNSTTWGGQNVYDVYSKSEGKALDGTNYRDW